MRTGLYRPVVKAASRLHIALYRASRGRIGERLWNLDVLLLTTTGRRSGRPRTNPLCCFPDGDAFVVVASNGGMDWYPAWWLNLTAHPAATVEVRGRRIEVRGREATPEERERLWAAITKVAPGYLGYAGKTTRTIPLGILDPV